MKSTDDHKLRIGLLVDSHDVPAWVYRMVEIIQRSDYAEVVLTVENDKTVQKVNCTLFEKVKNNKGRFFYLLIRRSLELIYGKLIDREARAENCFAPKNLNTLLPTSVVNIKTKPIKNSHSDRFTEEALEEIATHNVDVFVRLGFRILRGEILAAAKYGVWSIHHGDNRVNRGGPAGYWECMENWPEIGSILQILSEDLDNGLVLYRSFSSTSVFSIDNNINSYFWKSLHFLPRKLKELHKDGADTFFETAKSQNRHPQFYSKRLYLRPNNKEFALHVFGKVFQKIKHIYRSKKYIEQWQLKFDIRNEMSTSLWRYKSIVPPINKFWADPHVVFRNGKYFVFIEEYLYDTLKGHISVLEIKEDGSYTTPTQVLEKDYHLSYPFIIQHDNELYMVPESVENRTVELYRCVEFPHKWEFVKNLFQDVDLVDTTIIRKDGKWWLFANGVEHPAMSSWDELYLYYTDDLLNGEWQAHVQNPVISDCKRSRPAGAIFEYKGALYRPSQNSANRYGYGFNLNVIDVLNELEFSESVVTKVTPDWSEEVLATHTFNHIGRLSVIDALIKRKK